MVYYYKVLLHINSPGTLVKIYGIEGEGYDDLLP